MCQSLNIDTSRVDWKVDWNTAKKDYWDAELAIGTWVDFAEGKVDLLPVM